MVRITKGLGMAVLILGAVMVQGATMGPMGQEPSTFSKETKDVTDTGAFENKNWASNEKKSSNINTKDKKVDNATASRIGNAEATGETLNDLYKKSVKNHKTITEGEFPFFNFEEEYKKPVEDTFKDLEGLLPFFQLGADLFGDLDDYLFEDDYYYMNPIQEMYEQELFKENVNEIITVIEKVYPEELQEELKKLAEARNKKDITDEELKEIDSQEEEIFKKIHENAKTLEKEQALESIPEALHKDFIDLQDKGEILNEKYIKVIEKIEPINEEELTKDLESLKSSDDFVNIAQKYIKDLETKISDKMDAELKEGLKEHEEKVAIFNEKLDKIEEQKFEKAVKENFPALYEVFEKEFNQDKQTLEQEDKNVEDIENYSDNMSKKIFGTVVNNLDDDDSE